MFLLTQWHSSELLKAKKQSDIYEANITFFMDGVHDSVLTHHDKICALWNSQNISNSSKNSGSAVVHSSKSKDQSFAFVDKHWCHSIYTIGSKTKYDKK